MKELAYSHSNDKSQAEAGNKQLSRETEIAQPVTEAFITQSASQNLSHECTYFLWKLHFIGFPNCLSVMANLVCQLDYVYSQVKYKMLGTSVRDFS